MKILIFLCVFLATALPAQANDHGPVSLIINVTVGSDQFENLTATTAIDQPVTLSVTHPESNTKYELTLLVNYFDHNNKQAARVHLSVQEVSSSESLEEITISTAQYFNETVSFSISNEASSTIEGDVRVSM